MEIKEDNFEVVMIDSTKYRTKLQVSQHYYGHITGENSATKIKIERETKTEIEIPEQYQSGEIVIIGPSAFNVAAARKSLNCLIVALRMKQQFTHFLSIPMNHPDIIKKFNIFKEIVLEDCIGRDVDESLFIKPEKLHLTIGVMCLMDNEEIRFASNLLNEAKEKVITPLLDDHQPLKISLKGVSYMNKDPSKIKVLYATVQEDGILQQLADALVQHFHKAGFMKIKEFGLENVKLHVTLMNSKYRRAPKTNGGDATTPKKRRRPRHFDGSIILEKLGDFDFGVMELDDIHISERHAKRADGYYKPAHIIFCKEI